MSLAKVFHDHAKGRLSEFELGEVQKSLKESVTVTLEDNMLSASFYLGKGYRLIFMSRHDDGSCFRGSCELFMYVMKGKKIILDKQGSYLFDYFNASYGIFESKGLLLEDGLIRSYSETFMFVVSLVGYTEKVREANAQLGTVIEVLTNALASPKYVGMTSIMSE